MTLTPGPIESAKGRAKVVNLTHVAREPSRPVCLPTAERDRCAPAVTPLGHAKLRAGCAKTKLSGQTHCEDASDKQTVVRLQETVRDGEVLKVGPAPGLNAHFLQFRVHRVAHAKRLLGIDGMKGDA